MRDRWRWNKTDERNKFSVSGRANHFKNRNERAENGKRTLSPLLPLPLLYLSLFRQCFELNVETQTRLFPLAICPTKLVLMYVTGGVISRCLPRNTGGPVYRSLDSAATSTGERSMVNDLSGKVSRLTTC